MRRRLAPLALALVAAAGAAAGCAPKEPYESLSEYGFFTGNGSTQEPAPGVVPYDVISVLWADWSIKHRFIALPEDGRIGYEADAKWRFPIGTTIIKTFAYPYDYRDPSLGERLIETRLLVRREDGWTAHTYLWNDEQTDAFLLTTGTRVPVAWIDATGVDQTHDYHVPNVNQCSGCHGAPAVMDVLGLRTREVNRDFDFGAGLENQIDRFDALGMFDGPLPPAAERDALVDPLDPAATPEDRARSYLEMNCAHCHNAAGAASSTGLFLNIETTAPIDLGVCRTPFSAGNGTGGRLYDIVPGEPDASIMTFRMESKEPDVRMPELPIALSDPVGVALVTEWILGMPATGCP